MFDKYPYTNFHELNLDWIIEQVQNALKQWEQVEKDWNTLHDYVMDYFANLDVSQEISKKLDAMMKDGSLEEIIAPYVNGYINPLIGKLESQINEIGTGTPSGVYDTLAELRAAYPIGASGVYVVTADNDWYYWNGSAWSRGGDYVASSNTPDSIPPAAVNSKWVKNPIGFNVIEASLFRMGNVQNITETLFENGTLNTVVKAPGSVESGNTFTAGIRLANPIATFASANDSLPSRFMIIVTVNNPERFTRMYLSSNSSFDINSATYISNTSITYYHNTLCAVFDAGLHPTNYVDSKNAITNVFIYSNSPIAQNEEFEFAVYTTLRDSPYTESNNIYNDMFSRNIINSTSIPIEEIYIWKPNQAVSGYNYNNPFIRKLHETTKNSDIGFFIKFKTPFETISTTNKLAKNEYAIIMKVTEGFTIRYTGLSLEPNWNTNYFEPNLISIDKNKYIFQIPNNAEAKSVTVSTPSNIHFMYVRIAGDGEFDLNFDIVVNSPLDVFVNRETSKNYDIICYGDSLTAGAGANKSYPTLLSEKSKMSILNAGVGGEDTATIAARQGSNVMMVPSGIGANEPFDIISSYGSVFPLLQSADSVNPVSVNGQSGTMSRESGKYYITNITAGNRALPIRTYLSTLNASIYIYWAGTNGFTSIDEISTIIKSMTEYKGNKFLVLGITADAKEYLSELNEKLSIMFGSKFIDLHSLIIKYGLDMEEISPTVEDNEAIANNRIPPSLLTDTVHFNQNGYDCIAEFIWDRIKYFGWNN